MTLDQLLADIRTNRRILSWSRRRGLVLFAPNTYVPAIVRRAIVVYRSELQHLVEAADVRVCPAQDAHREYWIHSGSQHYTCQICARLDVVIRRKSVA